MKQKKEETKIYRFPFKLGKLTVALCILALILCVVGVTLSIWRISNEGINGITDALRNPFVILVCLLCALIITALLIKSQYVVDETNFTTQFGLIKSKTPVKSITAIEEDREKGRLTMYFGEDFSVVAVKKEWNDDFIHALLQVNPEIDYSFTMTENKPPESENEEK